MKLSISNIGWSKENDEAVCGIMRELGFSGLEIAPTRIFPDNPYDRLEEAKAWADKLSLECGFEIPSMQSIWYGRDEKLFGGETERESLLSYTEKAIDFAVAVGCGNLVFGCPRNRYMPIEAEENIAIEFFKRIGDYALKCGTVIGMEANPPIYNTNYINTTSEALELIKKVDSKGFRLNLDIGTIIENHEDLGVLLGSEFLINHVHISEPHLKIIEKRDLHTELFEILNSCSYDKYVSIEMGKQEDIGVIKSTMKYIKGIFG